MDTPIAPADSDNPTHRGPARRPLDYFLHPSLFEDVDTLRHARTLVAGMCMIIPLTFLSMLILMFAPIPAITRLFSLPASFILLSVLSVLLFKMKRDGSYDLCCNVTVGLLLIGVAYGVFITGGIASSPLAQLLVGPALIAFFLGGLRIGRNIAALTALIITVTLVLEHAGVKFPQLLETRQLGVTQWIVLMAGFSANAALAFIYESTSAALRNERDMEHRKVVQLAHTDSLTGLANRRVFDKTLAERIARYQFGKQKHPFAVCYLDLDGFKPINDRHGHDVGDEVLRAVSIRLRSSLRGADMIGRPGGDEFVLLLDQLEPGPTLDALADRFLAIIAEPIETSAGLVSIGGSFGFAFFPQHGTDAESLAKAADSAMYEAKRNRLGWRVFGEAPPSSTSP